MLGGVFSTIIIKIKPFMLLFWQNIDVCLGNSTYDRFNIVFLNRRVAFSV